MHVLQTLQALVNDVLLVNVLQDVSSDNCVQVGVHEVEYQVNITVILSTDDVLETDNILVTSQLLQENNLTESALSVSSVLESVKILLNGANFFSALVNGLPHNTVSSLA